MQTAHTAVRIDYTNHRGVRSWRRVVPESIEFGASEWHPEPQWLLWGFDLEKDAARTYAMKDIHAWEPLPEERKTP